MSGITMDDLCPRHDLGHEFTECTCPEGHPNRRPLAAKKERTDTRSIELPDYVWSTMDGMCNGRKETMSEFLIFLLSLYVQRMAGAFKAMDAEGK